MTKIAHVSPKGQPTMTVYYDEKAKEKPYRVYLEGYVWKWLDEAHSTGARYPSKRQIERYDDLLHATCEMCKYVSQVTQEAR